MPAVQAIKAEVILAIQLASRHRAARLAFGLTMVAAIGVGAGVRSPPGIVWVLAGAIASVGASRVTAPGPALLTAGEWFSPGLVTAGRLLGLALLLLPVTGIVVWVTGGPRGGGAAVVVAAGYGLVLGSLVMALSPWAGAAVAGTAGVFVAWIGQVHPTPGVVGSRSVVVDLLQWTWAVAPMSWRVEWGWRVESGAAALVAWIVAGWIAAWVSVWARTR